MCKHEMIMPNDIDDVGETKHAYWLIHARVLCSSFRYTCACHETLYSSEVIQVSPFLGMQIRLPFFHFCFFICKFKDFFSRRRMLHQSFSGVTFTLFINVSS